MTFPTVGAIFEERPRHIANILRELGQDKEQYETGNTRRGHLKANSDFQKGSGFLGLVLWLPASSRGAGWKSDDGAGFGGRGYLATQVLDDPARLFDHRRVRGCELSLGEIYAVLEADADMASGQI